MLSYLEQLTLRLALAIAEVPESIRTRQAAYLKSAQRADGGFAGRQGDSDLYYTGFALRSLALLGELEGEPAVRAAEFLRSRWAGCDSVIDLVSLSYGGVLLKNAAGLDCLPAAEADWHAQVSQMLTDLRRPDGGYAKSRAGAASSTYHTFLVLLCQQLLHCPPAEPQRLVEFVLSQRQAAGGFRETRVSQRAGTNPTAAAIGVLRILNALEPEVRADTLRFLTQMQTDEGGWRANTRIPIADLLSTFTGLLTIRDLGGGSAIDSAAALRYVESLQSPAGGFRGAVWDQETDVEYTFYGLGCLGLLQAPHASGQAG